MQIKGEFVRAVDRLSTICIMQGRMADVLRMVFHGLELGSQAGRCIPP